MSFRGGSSCSGDDHGCAGAQRCAVACFRGRCLPADLNVSPIFVGGVVRWLVDKYLRKKPDNLNLTEEQMAAETDKSPGVLLASGYIAGATLAGVIFAFMNLSEGIVARLKGFEEWAAHHNPFFEGPNSDVLGIIPFLILTILLYLVGRELVLKPSPIVRREE